MALSDGVWKDAALVTSDGSSHEHAFENDGVTSIIRRVISPPPDAEPGIVFASEISVFVSGRYRRATSGFSIYWHSHSDLVFALTGITHCTKIYVECGRRMDGHAELSKVPGIYMIRSSGRTVSAQSISWPDTPIHWPSDVKISLVHRRQPTLRLFKAPGESTLSVLQCRSAYSGISEKYDGQLDGAVDTCIFMDKLSNVYKRLTSCGLPITARMLINRCLELSNDKKITLLPESAIHNFFLVHVCLYVLGEESLAEEMIGVLYSRATPSDCTFCKHRVVLQRARDLCLALNFIYDNRGEFLLGDSRLDETDAVTMCVRGYYTRYTDVDNRIISNGISLLNAFYGTWSVSDAARLCGFSLSRAKRISKEDVVSILKL